jgi:hypothetical protein
VVERSVAALRVALIALAAANIIFFLYTRLAPDSRASRIAQLQINPERIRIVAAASRGPGGEMSAASIAGRFAGACLEWGPLDGSIVGRAEAALARLDVPAQRVQRTTSTQGLSYFVREPDQQTVSRFIELQRSFPGTSIRASACPPA